MKTPDPMDTPRDDEADVPASADGCDGTDCRIPAAHAPTADEWPDEVTGRATLTRCPMGTCLLGHHRGRGDALCIDGVWWHFVLHRDDGSDR